jgi:hypothetical protein
LGYVQKPADLGDVTNNLSGVMDSLHAWNGRTTGCIPKEIERKRTLLEMISMKSDDKSRKKIRQINVEIDELLEKEEIRWRKRSRINWLRAGDRNTQYFHRKATWRAKKNKIEKLQSANGTAITQIEKMQNMTTEYFQELYSADNFVQPNIITDLFEEKIDANMNESLCAEFTDEEIIFALFQIGPTKAPGPDGFPACSYQRNWSTLKEDIIAAVKNFFRDGDMPEGINDTAIVLIPKIKNPITLKDYRPISLCNVLYKVVVKCLVNRMRPLLHDLISESQSAFIPGRMITDNAIIAFECIH